MFARRLDIRRRMSTLSLSKASSLVPPAHLPVQKSHAVMSPVSITSKLIQTTGLQLQHFGHLRKTGGRGVLPACPERSRRVMPTSSPLELTEVEESPLPTPLFPLHTKIPLVSPLLPLHTRKQGGIPPGKCRRADIFGFSPDFSRFSCPERAAKGPSRASASLTSSAEGEARGLA